MFFFFLKVKKRAFRSFAKEEKNHKKTLERLSVISEEEQL